VLTSSSAHDATKSSESTYDQPVIIVTEEEARENEMTKAEGDEDLGFDAEERP